MFDYKTAGGLAFLSAALHVVGLALGGWATDALGLMVGTLVWLALGAGLRRGLRAVAYVTFLFAIFGAIYSLSAAMGSVLPSLKTLWWGIAAVDTLVLICLFGVLWAPREDAATT